MEKPNLELNKIVQVAIVCLSEAIDAIQQAERDGIFMAWDKAYLDDIFNDIKDAMENVASCGGVDIVGNILKSKGITL
jgi:hypothetical protein